MFMLIHSPAKNVVRPCMMTTTENQASPYMHVLSVETDSIPTIQRVLVIRIYLAGRLKVWRPDSSKLRCKVQNRFFQVICEKCSCSIFSHVVSQ